MPTTEGNGGQYGDAGGKMPVSVTYDPNQPLFGPGVDKKAPSPLCVSGKSLEYLRNHWGKKLNARRDQMRKLFRGELYLYLEVLRHEMKNLLPGQFGKNRVDVNVIYPIIKTLIPQLYYKDPKVLIEALDEKFNFEVTDETGNIVPDPAFPGGNQIETVNGPRAAALLAGAINRNLVAAKFKREAKMALQDALVCYYGAIKQGWDNEQGFYSMAPGSVPPSRNSAVQPGMAYGVRHKPWDVLVDDNNFYNPEWIALRYAVNPWNLKADGRLSNTDRIKGNVNTVQERFLGSATAKEQMNSEPLAEYYELYHRPCAEYPMGFFMMVSDEVKDDFLFLDKFPTEKTTELPVRLIYFNPDSEGGLPTPDIRYCIDQQRAKSYFRNVERDYVARSLPIFVVNKNLLADEQQAKEVVQSGRIPKVLLAKDDPVKVANGVSFNNLNADFRQFDQKIDDDISRTMGMINGAGPAGVADIELATIAKQGARGEAIRTGERADVVRDFITECMSYWVSLFQEYSGEKMAAPVEGPEDLFPGQDLKYPVSFSWRDIRGKFLIKIKPFSMNYEDPAIVRRQFLDLLNLLASPQVAEGLKRRGKMVDIEKIIKRIQETYDDRDVDQVVIDFLPTPEEQMMLAQQRQGLLSGFQPQVPGANPQRPAMKPGGGNKEGFPTNGVAVNQEAFRQPLEPNAARSAASMIREAENTR